MFVSTFVSLNYQMKLFFKIIKTFLKGLVIILVLLNVFILVSGKTYLYKGFANTYLKGRKTADIDEYKIFDNRIVQVGTPHKWALGKDYNASKIPAHFVPDMERMGTIAYLVIKDDSIRHEEKPLQHHSPLLNPNHRLHL